MTYFKLLIDVTDDTDIVCHCQDTHGFEQYELCEGVYVENWHEGITFTYDPRQGDRVTDYLANSQGWFLVSARFKQMLEGALPNEDVQFLPVRVMNQEDGSELLGYSVANILCVVDAINLEHSTHSVFELDGEKIYNIHKYALTESATQGKLVLKIKGDVLPVFVSGECKDLIERNQITGCDFLEVTVV